MDTTEAWRRYAELDSQKNKKIYEEGEVIKQFIESNRDRFKKVEVQVRDRQRDEFIPMSMLQISKMYYYREGKFYHLYCPSQEEQNVPVVDWIVGEALKALWQSRSFVRSVFNFPLGR